MTPEDQKRLSAAILTIRGFGLDVGHVSFDKPGGGETVYRPLTVDELIQYVLDPNVFAASYLGCTIDQYLRWLETDGAPKCMAVTARGRLCENQVLPRQQPIRVFIEHDRNGYCGVHGGGDA